MTNHDLFASGQLKQPLAERLRPKNLDQVVGQQHLLGPDGLIGGALAQSRLPSLILWGPPGVGKTTIARLLAQRIGAHFCSLSAVDAGLKDLRELVLQAKQRQARGESSLLFVDEVHRFHKGQQDAFLPHLESGLFTFVGATTENPSFELNKALLSRARVYQLKPLAVDDLLVILRRSLDDPHLSQQIQGASQQAQQLLAEAAEGDARKALGLLELAADSFPGLELQVEHLQSVLPERVAQFDKGGDSFYELISALHKSVRGSAPDAALYWLCRMLVAGCPGNYIARRLVRMASEEIGNADPAALQLAINAWQSMERLGSPEGELALAQTVLYLAAAPKSNAAYLAYKSMRALVEAMPSEAIPDHLCNAPTALLKELGKSKGYRYAHDEPHAYAAGEQYLPPIMAQRLAELPDARLYQPVERGLEVKIRQKLDFLRQLDQQHSAD